jgi:hypothetical protein
MAASKHYYVALHFDIIANIDIAVAFHEWYLAKQHKILSQMFATVVHDIFIIKLCPEVVPTVVPEYPFSEKKPSNEAGQPETQL